MDPTPVTVVSQLITDARARFGAHRVTRVEVDPDLLDETMDAVLSLGGDVGLDSAVVDGVEVVALPADVDVPRAHVEGEDQPRPLVAPPDGDEGDGRGV